MRSVVYDQPEVNTIRIKSRDLTHQKMLAAVLSCAPSSLLEVGAGQGRLGAMIAERGIRYVGIEPVDEALQEARRDYPSLTLVKASCFDKPSDLNLGKFDVVYSNDVIEHVYEPRAFAAFCRAHLDPGGKLICCTPDYGNYLKNLLLSITNRWDQHHAPLWDGGHIKFFSKRTLTELFTEFGFTNFVWGSVPSAKLPLIPNSIYFTATLK